MRRVIFAIVIVVVARPQSAAGQSTAHRFEVGVQIASARSSEFDANDLGVGGRFSWSPSRWLGLEAEIDQYPADFPDGRAFSRSRVEGLFGVTAGPTLDRVRVFGSARPGFVAFRDAPGPLVCILIFPPPLSCVLASGRTLFAFDVGGGVEVFTTPRTFVRVDVGDRILRYPGPAFDSRRVAHEKAFYSHDFRFAAGGGLRF